MHRVPREAGGVALAASLIGVFASLAGCGEANFSAPPGGSSIDSGPVQTLSAENGSCRVGLVLYEDGTSGIPAEDGCNLCVCSDGVLSCTDGACTGAACEADGVAYPHGTSGIRAGDGCNVCSCSHGTLCCSQMTCPAGACLVNDRVYPDGASDVPDPASCNTCRCSGGAIVDCTNEACALPAPCRAGSAVYQHGQGFTSGDGLFECICDAGSLDCASLR